MAVYPRIEIKGRIVGAGSPVYVIAEMSGNHAQNFQEAVRIIYAAREAGADAIKLQTYRPDTITIQSNADPFRVKGLIWQDQTLYDLYSQAFTPWEWHPELKRAAEQAGLACFSTPFDLTAVDFLETLDVPAYKIASFENVDIQLLRRVGQTGKPVILSTGMASLGEIEEAVHALRQGGANEIALLKCTSAYPAPPEEMNLRTIPHLREAFGLPVGLSDHTLGIEAALGAVALGASIVEKHLILSRGAESPDSTFSMEPGEFKGMVEAIRRLEKALGSVHYGVSEREAASRVYRRSLFVVKDMKPGDVFSMENVRSIRPGHGLHTRHLEDVLGRHALREIPRGTPLGWDLIGSRQTEPGNPHSASRGTGR